MLTFYTEAILAVEEKSSYHGWPSFTGTIQGFYQPFVTLHDKFSICKPNNLE